MSIPVRGILPVTVAVLALYTAPAWGSTVAYRVEVNDNGGDFPCRSGGTFELPQFDDQGGQRPLRWVALSITARATGGLLILDSECPDCGGFGSLAIGTDLLVWSDAAAATAVELALHGSASGSFTADDPAEAGEETTFLGIDVNADFAGADSLRAEMVDVCGQGAITLDAGQDDLSGFVGGGLVACRFEGLLHKSWSTTAWPYQTLTVPPQFHFEAEVIYGTDVYGIPEPASAALLAAGWIGLVLSRARRKGCGKGSVSGFSRLTGWANEVQ